MSGTASNIHLKKQESSLNHYQNYIRHQYTYFKSYNTMSPKWKWTDKMGKLTIRQKEREYEIDIYDGNVLAIFIYEYENEKGENDYILFNFFADKKYCDNIIMHGDRLFRDEVVSIGLNLYYKNAQTLLDIFVKNGYKVSCYYEKPKQ